jgi:prolipoprotein diacylglyceryltransferase
MSKLSVLFFGITLILLFSPTFAYYALAKIFPAIPSLQSQIISISLFIIGIILLIVQQIIKKPK